MDKLLFYAQSFVLGVVEGCTEFLPVSSTGHLIVFEALLGFRGSARYVETYSYVIQLGAVLVVAVLYRRQIGASLQAFWPRGGLQPRPWAETGLYFWLSLALACLPGLLAALLLGSLADAFFSQPGWVALALILGGAALCLAERFWARPATARPALPWPRVSMGQALTVGAFQCLAVLPGGQPQRQHHHRGMVCRAGHHRQRRLLLFPGHAGDGGDERPEADPAGRLCRYGPRRADRPGDRVCGQFPDGAAGGQTVHRLCGQTGHGPVRGLPHGVRLSDFGRAGKRQPCLRPLNSARSAHRSKSSARIEYPDGAFLRACLSGNGPPFRFASRQAMAKVFFPHSSVSSR